MSSSEQPATTDPVAPGVTGPTDPALTDATPDANAGANAGAPAPPFELLINAPDAGEAGSHYDRAAFLTATAGQEIARVTPGQRVDVGPNCEVTADGVVRATAAGRVNARGRKISVDPVLRIAENVDFATGHVDFAGDVIVNGNVVDLFNVRAAGSVMVRGAVEAARVECDADVRVVGGIVGHGKGLVRARGDVGCRFMKAAAVVAGGDVACHGEAVDSRVVCTGRFTSRTGAVIGGQVTANGGADVHTLGSVAGVRTVVEVGVDHGLAARCLAVLPEIEAQRKKAAEVKLTVAPLLRNAKALTAQQKERATELLYEAGEVEERTAAALKGLREQYVASQAKARAEVHVSHTLHPGAVVRFAQVEAAVTAAVRGPVTMRARQENHAWVVVAIDGRGFARPLPSREFKDAALAALRRLLGEDAPAPAARAKAA